MKRGILSLLLFSFVSFVQAQIPEAPASVQSPNAASLGLYGKVPVSLFTGLPVIEVPLVYGTGWENYGSYLVKLSCLRLPA